MTSPEMNFGQSSKQAKPATEQQVVRKPEELARELWKRLVANVGKRQAKEIMHHVMGDQETGPA